MRFFLNTSWSRDEQELKANYGFESQIIDIETLEDLYELANHCYEVNSSNRSLFRGLIIDWFSKPCNDEGLPEIEIYDDWRE